MSNGGDADGAAFAGDIAASVEEHNRQLHLNEREILAGMLGEDAIGEDVFDGRLSKLTEYEQRLLAAACARIHCADHLSADDPSYAQRRALQGRGFDLIGANDAAFRDLAQARNDYFKQNGKTTLTSRDTITSLHEGNAKFSGQAQGGFLYTGLDARKDVARATGVDLYGQARAESGPASILPKAAQTAIAAVDTFLRAVDCTTNAEACQALWDDAKQSVSGTIDAIRALPDYPELLESQDLAVARFIDGKISREAFVTVLADAGHITGDAQTAIVGLGLTAVGGGSVIKPPRQKQDAGDKKPTEIANEGNADVGGSAANSATIGGKTCIYDCVVDGTTRYVGITNDVTRRGAEHMAQKGIRIEQIDGLDGLSRSDARAVEQTLIHIYGLGKDGGTLINKINSISPTKNPTAYEQSLKRGFELLDSIDYQWKF